MAERTDLARFGTVYPTLRDAVLGHARLYKLPEAQISWFKSSLDINPIGGKCNRGMAVPDSVSILLGMKLDNEVFFQASALGWMIELLQASFLVSDDIMDGNNTRRGRKCWHREEGVGLNAINDAFMLEAAIYVLFKKFFRSHPSYVPMMELLHETSFQTEMGQLCDLTAVQYSSDCKTTMVHLDRFTSERYKFIAIHKTAYYSFFLPVALALHMLSLASPENLQVTKRITLLLGEYFQIQDDFLDCYGDPEEIGKDGSDIRDGKCSWLIVQALERASPEQRQILEGAYGRVEGQGRVKEIYDSMNLKTTYRDFEEARVAEIRDVIGEIDESNGLKRDVFTVFLDKIYGRRR